jgi:hypothetical protein
LATEKTGAYRIQAWVLKTCLAIVASEFVVAMAAVGYFLAVEWRARPTLDPRAQSSIYKGLAWAQAYWREFALSSKVEYRAYVGWGMVPYHAETIVTDPEGYRRTFDTRCDDATYTVWMFGGSTLWGEGLPDWLTLPSHLAREYVNAGQPVCVRNFGVRAWVSTQEVVALMLELKRARRKPDLVIFYDGINDVFSFYQSGLVDVHQNYNHIREIFAQGGRLPSVLADTLVQVLHFWQQQPRPPLPISRPEAQAQLDGAYLENVHLVEGLAKQYGFEYAFFWQPVLLATHKVLTPEEENAQQSALKKFPALDLYCRNFYDLIHRELRPHLSDISDALDPQKGTLYIDLAHVGPEGSRLIAARMYQALHPRADSAPGSRNGGRSKQGIDEWRDGRGLRKEQKDSQEQ